MSGCRVDRCPFEALDSRVGLCARHTLDPLAPVPVPAPEPEKRCADCGRTFALSESERAFYWMGNLAAPKRCSDCRGMPHPPRFVRRGIAGDVRKGDS